MISVVICSFILTVGHVDSTKTRSVFVQTSEGRLRGEVVFPHPSDGTYTTRFLGVPYASPPVGDLRFSAPVPPPPRPGTLNVTQYKQPCHSLRDGGSEDCLHVDVYIPRDGSRGMPLSLPVMVHLHGFSHGPTEPLVSPELLVSLAHRGDVIVVDVSSRTGVLGFASTGDAVIPGNNGLRDQTQALKWLKQNIKSFGGNPALVTLFGQGEGGIAVSHHLLSPLSVGLFRRGISHGGVALNPNHINRHPVSTLRQLAGALRCSPANSSRGLVRCLRAASAVRLRTSSRTYEREWLPVIDRQFIRVDPIKVLHDPRIARYDYMVGADKAGTDALLQTILQDKHDQRPLSPAAVTDAIETRIRSDAIRDYRQNAVQVAKIVQMEYDVSCSSSRRGQDRRGRLVEMLADHGALAPAELMARLYDAAGARTYLYEYTRADPSTRHTDQATKHRYFTPDVLRGWTNFAKTGNPNQLSGDKRLYWRLYNQGHYVHFSGANTTAHVGFHPRRMAFWNDYLPHVQNTGPCDAPTVSSPRDEAQAPHTPISVDKDTIMNEAAEVINVQPKDASSLSNGRDHVRALYVIIAVLTSLLCVALAFLAFTVWKLYKVKISRKTSEKEVTYKQTLNHSDTLNQTQPLNQTEPLNQTDIALIS